jgi:hypothetical protein
MKRFDAIDKLEPRTTVDQPRSTDVDPNGFVHSIEAVD